MSIPSLILTGLLGLLLSLPAYSQEAQYWRPDGLHLPPGDTAALLAWARPWAARQLGQPEAGLHLTTAQASPAGWHYALVQTQAGLPVWETGVKVHTGPAGRVYSVLFALQPLPPARGDFQASEADLALTLGETLGATTVEIDRGYLPHEGQLWPAYRALASSYDPAFSYELFLAAETGHELRRRDAATYWHSGGDTTGRGRVFSPDPCTRAQQPYGVLFTDSADWHNPVFDGLMDTVILRDLTYRDGQFWLEGPHVKVEDRAAFFFPIATSPDGDFFFRRDESGFEDVMVYYHVDTFQRYVQSLGFDDLQNRPFPIDPHGLGNSDQSAFFENNGNPYILMGDGGVDDAEDADVIIHEYIHALSYAAAPSTNSGLERRGLDEGIADYFTAAYSYDLNPWRWHELFNWDGHNEFWPGRWATSMRAYPPTGNTSIYVYGEIWASALMQARQDLGGTLCDRLALAHLYTLGVGMTLPQAALTLLDVDSVLYGGVHVPVLRQYFCQRGVLQGISCNTVGADPLPTLPHWTFGPNPTSGPLTVEWDGPPLPDSPVLTLINAWGQVVGRYPLAPTGPTRLHLSLPAGLYLARLQAGGQALGTHRLWVK